MTYKVSLSRLFKDQVAQIKEFDTIINSKKVIQNIKETATDLEKMQRSGISLQTTRIQSNNLISKLYGNCSLFLFSLFILLSLVFT